MYIHSFFMLMMMMMLSVYKCRKFRKFLYMYIRFDRFYFSLSCINLVHIYTYMFLCVYRICVMMMRWCATLLYIYTYVVAACIFGERREKKIGEERFECVFCFGLRSVCCWSDEEERREDSQFLFLWCFIFGFPSLLTSIFMAYNHSILSLSLFLMLILID